MAIAPIASVMTALKSVKDLTETIIDLRDRETFQQKRLELQSVVLDAQQSAFASQQERASLIDQVRGLEADIAALRAWDAERERYELRSPGTGAYAYAVKPGVESGEPAHWLCCTCFQAGKKSILQAAREQDRMSTKPWICPSCKTTIFVDAMTKP